MSLKAASPSALPQEREPGQQAGLQGWRPGLSCQRLSAGGGEQAAAGLGSVQCTDAFGNPRLGFLSICGWGVDPWVFWVILCTLVQTLHFAAILLSKCLTIDSFYNGFLQNVPSLLLLVTKVFS